MEASETAPSYGGRLAQKECQKHHFGGSKLGCLEEIPWKLGTKTEIPIQME
jgi:hypothetical protein